MSMEYVRGKFDFDSEEPIPSEKPRRDYSELRKFLLEWYLAFAVAYVGLRLCWLFALASAWNDYHPVVNWFLQICWDFFGILLR